MPEESGNVVCNANGDVKVEAESLRSKPAVSSKQGSEWISPEIHSPIELLEEGKKQDSGNVVYNGDGEKDEKEEVEEGDCRLVGEVIPDEEARQRWPERYEPKKKNTQASGSKSPKDKDDSEEIVKARCHYRQAEIDGRVIVNLNDDAHVKIRYLNFKNNIYEF
ncbi:hypothetical protein AAG906_015532 [Vitis piasezkii]